ncbi:Type II inositol 1,4,5-trisphosphate 5-phosphatase [Schistosoma japonicum]|nr:Type II inositol 1,4,5-trisphosphate 5-phosphatase [Schistosoma japonicum]KAH8873807.1 Type II inositol 1,4,5-trisphosphate 5-phosphatase [Schistosoma japonicum]
MSSQNNLTTTVQRYVNMHSSKGSEVPINNHKPEESSGDFCNIAFPVYTTEYGRYLCIIASVITNRPSKQSAIFIFTQSQSSDLDPVGLILIDLILLDNEFSCDVDEPRHIYITGRRLLNTTINNDINDHYGISIQEDISHVHSSPSFKNDTKNVNLDNESTVVKTGSDLSKQHINNVQKKTENVNSQIQLNGSYRSEFASLLLEFFNSDDAINFQKIITHCSIDCLKSLSVPELTPTNHIKFYLNGELNDEILPSHNLQGQFDWLNKYLQSMEKISIDLVPKLPYSNSLVVSDSSSINENNYDHLNAISLQTKTNSCPSLDDAKPSGQNKYTKVKRQISKRLVKVRRCHSSVSPSSAKQGLKPLVSVMGKNSLNISQCNLNNCYTESPVVTNLTSPNSFSDLRFITDLRNKYRNLEPHGSDIRDCSNNVQKDSTREYLTSKRIRIFIGTWNINGRDGSNLNLDEWLKPPEGQPPADLYVFGLQELDLSFKVITFNKIGSSRPEDLWIQQLEGALGGLLKSPNTSKSPGVHRSETDTNFAAYWSQYTGGGYVRVRRVRLAGIMMIVYISAKFSIHLRHHEVSQQVVPTGVLNVMGNKGGVSLRLTIFNTSLCFVNCHLAAGKEKLNRRNQDFKEIIRKMSLLFPINPKYFPFPVTKSNFSIHDVIFVFGDLNYRITGLDSDSVRRLIHQNNFIGLLKNDELSKEFNSRKIFQGFREQKITFAPTYKFDINCQTYDSSEKYRIPAYCDRIIWYGRGCVPIAYRSHPSYICSDHKPISGYFLVEVS